MNCKDYQDFQQEDSFPSDYVSVRLDLLDDYNLSSGCKITYIYLLSIWNHQGFTDISNEELADELRFDLSTVQKHLNLLEKHDYIVRDTRYLGFKKLRTIWEYRSYLLANELCEGGAE